MPMYIFRVKPDREVKVREEKELTDRSPIYIKMIVNVAWSASCVSRIVISKSTGPTFHKEEHYDFMNL